MVGSLIAAGLVVGTGLLLLLLGYLIKAKGLATLIAGYDPKKVKDENGLTDWVGTNAMWVGAILCLHGLLILWLPQKVGLLIHLGFAAVIMALAVRTAVGASRY